MLDKISIGDYTQACISLQLQFRTWCKAHRFYQNSYRRWQELEIEFFQQRKAQEEQRAREASEATPGTKLDT